MAKIVLTQAQRKAGARISDRMRRHGGTADDRRVTFLAYEAALRDAADRHRPDAERAFRRELAAALRDLLRDTYPLFESRRQQRAKQRQRQAPTVARKVFRRSAPRARRRSARRTLAARAGPDDGNGGGDPPDPGLATLERFRKSRVWRLLPFAARYEIAELLARYGVDAAAEIGLILSEASLARGECPIVGELWLSTHVPTGMAMIRAPDGLWRMFPCELAHAQVASHALWGRA
jgi:hypothetical protein